MKARAQITQYQKFKVDVMLGLPLGIGFIGSIEPQYHLSSRLTIGAEAQLALVLGSLEDFTAIDNGKPYVIANEGNYIQHIYTLSFTTEYLIVKGKRWKPFVGGGIGRNYWVNEGYPLGAKPLKSPLSLFPRVGVETGHFRVSAAVYLSQELHFAELKAGFYFGGSRKK